MSWQIIKHSRLFFILVFINIALCVACSPTQSEDIAQPQNQTDQRVNAQQYSSFWIWGNISSAAYLHHAKELYILQGEMNWDRAKRTSVFIPQGIAILQKPQQKIWLVICSHHLNWSEANVEMVIQQWKNAGNHIQGLQIDFDAKTQNLQQYAVFLQKIRQQLPQEYRLSITGLMDWTNLQNPNTLTLLRQNIDDIAIQTHRGSTTISNYSAYLAKVAQLQLPYKIGLVQHGQWQAPKHLAQDPNFKSYVVFLLHSKPESIPQNN